MSKRNRNPIPPIGFKVGLHTGKQQKYECMNCKRMFASNKATAHKRFCDDRKANKTCDICGKLFPSKFNKVRHQQSLHKDAASSNGAQSVNFDSNENNMSKQTNQTLTSELFQSHDHTLSVSTIGEEVPKDTTTVTVTATATSTIAAASINVVLDTNIFINKLNNLKNNVKNGKFLKIIVKKIICICSYFKFYRQSRPLFCTVQGNWGVRWTEARNCNK
jgi:hypothetical protein